MSGASEFEELYDDETLAALDGWHDRATPAPAHGVRGGAAAGALVAVLALGMQEVLDPRPPEEVVIEVDAREPYDPDQPVRLVYVPHAPRATKAFVRPWLLVQRS
jgi:hypothetical protein